MPHGSDAAACPNASRANGKLHSRPAASGRRSAPVSRRRLRSTVEPDQPRFDRADEEYPRLRPGVLSEARSDVLLIGRLNEVQRSMVVTDRTAEDHEAVIDERVHERRMAVPAALLADLPPRIPGGPMNDSYGEGSHAQTVDASTDNPAATRNAHRSVGACGPSNGVRRGLQPARRIRSHPANRGQLSAATPAWRSPPSSSASFASSLPGSLSGSVAGGADLRDRRHQADRAGPGPA
jgi:hypothetical protein